MIMSFQELKSEEHVLNLLYCLNYFNDSQSVGRWVSGQSVDGYVVSGRWVGGSVVGGFKRQKTTKQVNSLIYPTGYGYIYS